MDYVMDHVCGYINRVRDFILRAEHVRLKSWIFLGVGRRVRG